MLDRKAARALTDRIKSNTTDYAHLIYEAWTGKAWLPLGYDSFTAYLQEEIGISRSRGYQLINITLLEQKLKELAVFPDGFTISDYATRIIIKHGVDDFFTALHPLLGTDTASNEEQFLTLLQQVRTGKTASTQPTTAQNIGYAAEASAQAFRIHCLHLPTPDVVEDPKMLPVVRGKLRDAVAVAEARLAEYAAVLSAASQEAV
ncbi:hypothetical protein AB0O65_10975 [Microbacterium sp. NPDC077391]|uniref:hypothetical protein n=1 Tax=Microbacterium sp. NPDC077391 TaxID=3154765 RepID=UPI00344A9EFD